MLKNASIGLRLALAFALIIVLMLVGAIFSLARLNALEREFSRLTDERVAKLELMQDAIVNADALEQAVNNALLSVGNQDAIKAVDDNKRHGEEVTRRLLELGRRGVEQAADQPLLAALSASSAVLYAAVDKVRTRLAAGDAVQAMDDMLNGVAPAKRDQVAALGKLRERERAHISAARRAASEAYVSVQRTMIGLAIASIIVAVTVGLLITRSVTAPLQKVLGATEDLRAGAGDLTFRLPPLAAEFGSLSASLNGFIEKLHDVIASVARASSNVSTAARELAQGHVHLSSRTEQQATTLEQTNASVAQLVDTVRRNSEHIERTHRLADATADIIGRGRKVTGEVVATMSKISASSAKVGEIVGVIDSIAFQTNILALNAAVEAARAGPQGKGFAVVAAEVRNLAQRAATAAKEIKELVSVSLKDVTRGTQLVEQSGANMIQTVTHIRELSDVVAQISKASREQSEVFRQISQAVQHIEQGAHQNAALVEEASAATTSLEHQVGSLDAAVRAFKLEGEVVSSWEPAADTAKRLQTNVSYSQRVLINQ